MACRRCGSVDVDACGLCKELPVYCKRCEEWDACAGESHMWCTLSEGDVEALGAPHYVIHDRCLWSREHLLDGGFPNEQRPS